MHVKPKQNHFRFLNSAAYKTEGKPWKLLLNINHASICCTAAIEIQIWETTCEGLLHLRTLSLCAYQCPSPPMEAHEHLLCGLEAFCGELQVTLILMLRTTPSPGQPRGSRFVIYSISKKLLQKEGKNVSLLVTWDGSISMFELKFMAKFDVLITHVNI